MNDNKQSLCLILHTFILQLTYNPHTIDTTSVDYFHIIAIGNISKSVVKCQGESTGQYAN